MTKVGARVILNVASEVNGFLGFLRSAAQNVVNIVVSKGFGAARISMQPVQNLYVQMYANGLFNGAPGAALLRLGANQIAS